MHSWYTIERTYWKTQYLKTFKIRDEFKEEFRTDLCEVWIRNANYISKTTGKNILFSDAAWLNDKFIDATPRLTAARVGIQLRSSRS